MTTPRRWTTVERLPRIGRCEITATPLHVNRRSPQDAGACAPEVKAAIDGLVDAGVLTDDNATHVAAIRFEHPNICGRDGLRIDIQERD